MFAGGRLRFHEPLRFGDEVTRSSRLVDVRVKEGRSGQMAFATIRHDFTRGETLLIEEEQDIVYRSQAIPGVTAAAPVPCDGAEPPPGEWRFEVSTDPTLLFRFSALTYNSHRIHYDEPYTRSVEGYPGLVVHGPLLALLLLELPRRHQPQADVSSFEFRLSRPVFCGRTVVVTGLPDNERLSLSAGTVGSVPSVTGTAVVRGTGLAHPVVHAESIPGGQSL
jgi:3-methylfumaryl-CoA hydratase